MQSTLRLKGLLVITLLPALLLYSFFVIIPIFWSSYYGFFEWSGLGKATYIGFQNYMEVIQSPVFWRSFKNNMIIVGGVCFWAGSYSTGISTHVKES